MKAKRQRGKRQRGRKQDFQTVRRQSTSAKEESSGPFHNPYNFIPAPPRNPEDPELGDCKPSGHDRYQPDLWTGHIAVRLVTQTPLLIPDAGKFRLLEDDRKRDHKIFPIRLDSQNRPYLPPTSIKGMLRSAYEAVTNSRFAVFEKHKNRLAYRMEARASKGGPVPARVEERSGKLYFRFMKRAVKLPLYAPIKRKDRGAKEIRAVLLGSNKDLLNHGDAVWVKLDDRSRVTKIRLSSDAPAGIQTKGWACITGPNISNKRCERVFLEGGDRKPILINQTHRELWSSLIKDYQEAHEQQVKERVKSGHAPQDYLGDDPGQTAWSRHVYTKSELELHDGLLCYVQFEENNEDIAAILPVTISRKRFRCSPEDLLPDSLKPATTICHLSPADRVFGWVKQKTADTNPNNTGVQHAAYRGNLRIGPVRCISPDPIEEFDYDGLPLAILGQPKPQQARFYVAASERGEMQENGISKEKAGYSPGKGLRGRKVYPHHAGLPEDYWQNPLHDRTQKSSEGFFQEYRRPHESIKQNGEAKLNGERTGFELQPAAEQRDNQNRSIKAWVKPNTQFEFEIDITNLTDVELGALIWLLSLCEGHFHRLGGGKPLGFGSVHLDIDWTNTDLRTGDRWRRFYKKLDEIQESLDDKIQSSASPKTPVGCKTAFMNAVRRVSGSKDFDQVSFIAAFKSCARGFGKPIHYPRAAVLGQRQNGTIPPHPDGKSFEWFVANERTGKQAGPKLSLPDLENDKGLPILQERSGE